MEEEYKIKETEEREDFEAYAFAITGIIVGVLLLGPELLPVFAEVVLTIVLSGILGVDININIGLNRDIAANIETALQQLEYGNMGRGFNELRYFSPLLFLLTTTIVFFKDAFDTRKSGDYTGSMFTHSFGSLFEDSICMAITTIMVYASVLAGTMWSSWLASPVTWILFIFIFPLVKKEKGGKPIPWLLLLVFVTGIIAEIITRVWLAFPLAWLIICVVKFIEIVRKNDYEVNRAFNIIYYAFSVAFMSIGIFLNFWIISWLAFPIALVICWVLNKFGMVKIGKYARKV